MKSIKSIIKYIEDTLEETNLNEEDYIIVLYKVLNDLKEIRNE